MPVKPATWRRRILAQTADLSLMGMALVLVARVLPDGPPPADAMAFFTQQDFINYFSLVTLALALTVAVFQSVVVTHATPGQYLLKLRLVTLDGRKPSREHVNTRQTRALINMLLILPAGPVIALLVGATAAALLNIPFTTTDRVLLQLELPQGIRYAIHGVSFLALLVATWAIAIRPAVAYFERANGGLTGLDVRSRTTHVHLGNV